MPPCKPVDLCTQLMPSGKLCRGIALKNERFCRTHIRNHRIAERQRQHDEAIMRLGAELDALELPDLLIALNEKLNRITSIVRAYPEARVALDIAIDRLARLTSPQSNASAQLLPNHMLAGLSPDLIHQFKHLLAGSPESNT
jgi:hypothetical protein